MARSSDKVVGRFGTVVFITTAIVVTGVLVYWAIKVHRESFELTCIASSVDGEKYCVRDTDRRQTSADMLAEAAVRMQTLVDHLSNSEKYGNDEVVVRLSYNFDPRQITEILPDSDHVAFSENKTKMSFCLTEKKEDDSPYVDMNTLMFVCLHEMAHLCTASIGHRTEFWDNFKFLLREAETIGIYKPQDYRETPQEYCGMDITSSPLFA
jgi:WLM domain